MGEWLGVAIAIASSSLGGTAAAVTRYLVGDADPLTLAILRWGIGCLCVLPARKAKEKIRAGDFCVIVADARRAPAQSRDHQSQCHKR